LSKAPSAAGVWSSNRGITLLSEEKGLVTGEYICTGTLHGKVSEGEVTIDWTSPDGGGKAVWKRNEAGGLLGTWTWGPEDKAGGEWNLKPLAAASSSDLSGSYESNFGPVHLKQEGARIEGTYECPGGVIQGTRDGNTIAYAWQGSDSMGHGSWTLGDDGQTLTGRWGFGPSADAGGSWNLKRDEADKRPVRPEFKVEPGTMHSGILRDAIVRNHGSFRTCLDLALKAEEAYPDRMNISVVVLPSGDLVDVSLDPVDKERKFDRCLAEKLRAWRFPPFRGDPWKESFPYVFNAPPAD
jgi:hypothetical protein